MWKSSLALLTDHLKNRGVPVPRTDGGKCKDHSDNYPRPPRILGAHLGSGVREGHVAFSQNYGHEDARRFPSRQVVVKHGLC